uniref:Probable purine permease n=1 Tax=Ananas comosus var. bracteatus TaxID=296719 RepID=A0A6V7NIV4_ANACO|nr:unnamed protein product [Ananas comosus var. bracteatus]
MSGQDKDPRIDRLEAEAASPPARLLSRVSLPPVALSKVFLPSLLPLSPQPPWISATVAAPLAPLVPRPSPLSWISASAAALSPLSSLAPRPSRASRPLPRSSLAALAPRPSRPAATSDADAAAAAVAAAAVATAVTSAAIEFLPRSSLTDTVPSRPVPHRPSPCDGQRGATPLSSSNRNLDARIIKRCIIHVQSFTTKSDVPSVAMVARGGCEYLLPPCRPNRCYPPGPILLQPRVCADTGASATYSLILSLMQLTFEKVIQRETFSVVLDMQIYTALVATCASVVGLFASGEWRSLKGEMEAYKTGTVSYVMTLVWTAVSWQVASVGVVGLIFVVTSLFSNVISTLSLPVVPIFAVIFFHDKMDDVKIMAMLISIWGFVSYLYQHYLDDSKGKKPSTNAQEEA